MKHGAPIAGSELGHAAPFVLEVGVSSTLEILRFWELAPASVQSAAEGRERVPPPLTRPEQTHETMRETMRGTTHQAAPERGRGPNRSAEAFTGPSRNSRVDAIIRKSLKAAGLLR
jgi:hypothetical protein